MTDDDRTKFNPFPVREEWLARHSEAVLEPALAIVDPHHHLWHHAQRYLLDELRADTGAGHLIEATVHVQAHSMYRADGDDALKPVGETEFVNGVAAVGASRRYGDTLFCAGIVGFADLGLGADVRRVLEAHLAAGGGRFRGIRNVAQWHDDPALPDTELGPGLLAVPEVQAGARVLAEMGLTFESWIYHTQIDEFAAFADAVPVLTCILDHAGTPAPSPTLREDPARIFDAWAEAIARLSTRDNVRLKFGGFGMAFTGFGYERRDVPPGSEELAHDWAPYFKVCLEAFGPSRMMFESNFPADKSSFSYVTLWNAFKRLSANLPPATRAALFNGTARAVYGI